MAITKALSDPNRVRVLMALRQGELCACQITELFGRSASTMSKHLSILNQAGLVRSRKEGRWIYYRLPTLAEVANAARWAIDWTVKFVKKEKPVLKDEKLLKKILKMDASELCRRQCGGKKC